MSDQHDDLEKTATTRTDLPDAARRRFATAGLIAPVILTLSGRTAWATGGHGGWGGGGGNCTESGMLSGNLSDPGPPCGGEGCSPGYWKNHTERWHPNYPPTAMFHSVFGVNAFPGASLYSVIWQQAEPYIETCTGGQLDHCKGKLKVLGFHTVAALQNAATEVSFKYDTFAVKAKFLAVYLSGSKQAIEWLKNEFDAENNMGCPLS